MSNVAHRYVHKEVPSLFGRESLPAHGLSIRMPSLDLYEEKDDVVVKAELPGMGKEEIEVTVSGDVVTIKGEKVRGLGEVGK